LLLYIGNVLPISHNPAVNIIDLAEIDGWYPNVLDIHPFKYTDLMKNANYIWGAESWEKMRPDRPVTNPEKPQNPLYMPYACLTTGYVANLLIPGYGAGGSSYAWGEVRVFPNLCVLGDAAGIAAAYSVVKNIPALEIGWSATHIKAVQNDLLAIGARLEK
jgi:hypothetical protein